MTESSKFYLLSNGQLSGKLTVEGSRFMREVFKKIEKQRVRKRWKKIKVHLTGNKGDEPALDYSLDE